MKKKNTIITICIIIAIISIVTGLIILLTYNGKTESKTNLPEKTSTKVTNGKAEEIMYDGIKIYGSYKNGVMNIKLENTTKDDFIIKAVTMKTYKGGKELNNHKFDVNQLLQAGKETTMNFMEQTEDFEKIDYEITKEKVKN